MKIRETFLPLAVPDLTELETNEVLDSLKSGWISVGPKVRKFERMFAGIHQTPYATAVNSATSALFLVCKVLGIGPGHKVIVPTITWPSTANVIEQLGGTPVFVDVDRYTGNTTPEIVETKILEMKKNIQLIIPVHMSGLPVDIDGFEEISKKYSIPILYDAAHAVFSEYRDMPVGKCGIASVFSFYATKNITTGDGGMITTTSEEIFEKVSLWSYHGMNKDSWKRYSEEGASPHVQSIVPGYKFNMTDLQAALGLAQLRRKDYLLSKRNELITHYNRLFKDVDYIQTPVFETGNGKWGNHVYVIKFPDDAVDRDKFMQELRKLNIGTNLHFYPVHKNLYYMKKYPGITLPNAEWLMTRILTLPLCTKYSKADIEYVVEAVKYVYESKSAHKA